MQLRKWKNEDAKSIVKWIKSERELRLWSADRYENYPITEFDIINNYKECQRNNNFYPLTLVDKNNSIYDILTGERYNEEDKIFEKYNLLPSIEEWKEKILFLETCEETISPEKLKMFLLELKKRRILDSVKGLLIGKPMDEIFYDEYKKVYKKAQI